jgi:hypothetical protein
VNTTPTGWVIVHSVSEKSKEQQMEYVIGLILAMAVAGLSSTVGFDRKRAFYPTGMIVIASYYVLFAAMGASSRTLPTEIAVAAFCWLPCWASRETSG